MTEGAVSTFGRLAGGREQAGKLCLDGIYDYYSANS